MSSNDEAHSNDTPPNIIKRPVGGSSKKDMAWDHAKKVEGKPRNLICKYCSKEFTGSAYRFKHHLACTHKDVEPCMQVPDEVRDKFRDIVHELSLTSQKKKSLYVDIGMNSTDDEESERMSKKSKGSLTSFYNKNSPTTPTSRFSGKATINTWLKKDLRDEAVMDTCWFLYENAIPFNVVRSSSFTKMCESIARHGPGYQPATYHEVRESGLKKAVISTNEFVDEHRVEWKRVGCTIMSDGWTDIKRRSILNFMVNCPKGTIFMQSIDASDIVKDASYIFKILDAFVDEIGEENVVQVVTDNASNYVKAGELLMEKRKHLYWMPCQAHCCDLILEDFEKKLPIHKETIAKGRKITTFIYGRTLLISMMKSYTKGKDLIRPVMTRFATAYLTLGCLFELKSNIMAMFASENWKNSRFASKTLGKEVEAIVMDNEFWINVKNCLKAAFPLIKVLRLVDSDVMPVMPFIYEAIEIAQESIKKNFNNVKKSYEPILNIVNERWLNKMSKPLHLIAYYLNPRVFYKEGFQERYEIKKAWYEVCERMIADEELIGKMDRQLNEFRHKEGLFGIPAARVNLHKMNPAVWWESYGVSVPELQSFAIHILSLTCSSSGCERNWSAFERVHTKRRNRLSQKKMHDLVYVMYNKKISNKKPKKFDGVDLEDFPLDDEWIANIDDEEDDKDVDDEDDVINVGDAPSREHLEDMDFGEFDIDSGVVDHGVSPSVEIYGDVGGASIRPENDDDVFI